MGDADASGSVHDESYHQEAESSSANLSTAVVFQCAQCNSIIGDSTSWLTANKVMRTITLSSTTSKVGVQPAIEMSKSGVDKDSTYHVLYCLCCNEVLGKQYLASSPQLDQIRGKFTVLVEKLNSYEIGSAMKGGQADLADLLTVPSATYLQQEVGKLRYVIMSLNDRIKTLESHLNLERNNSLSSAADQYQSGKENTSKTDKTVSEDSESVSSSENVTNSNQLQNQQMFRNFGSPCQISQRAGKENQGGNRSARNARGDNPNNDVTYNSNQDGRRGLRNTERSRELSNTRSRAPIDRNGRLLRDVRDDIRDDETNVSETVSMNRDCMAETGPSLMEEWPSPRAPKSRGVKRRKCDDNQ